MTRFWQWESARSRLVASCLHACILASSGPARCRRCFISLTFALEKAPKERFVPMHILFIILPFPLPLKFSLLQKTLAFPFDHERPHQSQSLQFFVKSYSNHYNFSSNPIPIITISRQILFQSLQFLVKSYSNHYNF